MCLILRLLIFFFSFMPLAQAMEQWTLSINNQPFYLEVPVLVTEYNQGLMYRHHLERRHGMIFVFDVNEKHKPTMWMKNTFIPLDMLFIGPDYRIACILEDTEPLSLTLLSCDRPVMAVIELNAGEANQFHLVNGMEIKGYIAE